LITDLAAIKAFLMCKLIKAKYPNLPVLALSCNNNIHDIYSLYGFNDYIKKPFDLDELYAILRKHIPDQKAKADKQQISY
jgi:DNA-binding response OmpR family regulator